MPKNEQKFKKICDFYAITHKLKETIRTGWKLWEISADRLESVAEHIYGTQMLAFAVNSELNLKMDMQKVIMMLAFHELGECVIGDITRYDNVTSEEKHKIERDAVVKILSPLSDKEEILALFDEFETRREKDVSKEVKFCFFIDQLECFLQEKYYDEKGKAKLHKKSAYANMEKVRTNELKNGAKTFSQMFINNALSTLDFDKVFVDLCHYVRDNKIFD